MQSSIILAKILGSYYCLMAVLMWLRPATLNQYIRDLKVESPSNLVAAIVAIIVGILILVFHPNFSISWPVIITLSGVASVFKGCLWFLAPELMVKMTKRHQGRHYFFIASCLVFILGASLWLGVVASLV